MEQFEYSWLVDVLKASGFHHNNLAIRTISSNSDQYCLILSALPLYE